MTRPPTRLLTVVVCALSGLSCNDDPSADTEAQEKIEVASRTVSVTPQAAIQGQQAFATCAACHGPEGEGRVGIAPSITSKTFLAAASDEMLLKVIANGRPGTTMPSWKSLGDKTIASLVVFLRAKSPTEPAELDQSPLRGNVADGEKLFKSICADCHGRTGAGYQESSSGTGIGRHGFLDNATNGYLRYVIKHGKSGTQMKPFSGVKTSVVNLTDQEIEDVIAYLRKSAW